MDALLKALNDERSALSAFVALLEREQDLLLNNQVDQLLEVAEQKSGDALALNELAEKRHKLLRQFNSGNATTESWFRENRPDALSIWQDIDSMTKRAQHLNQTNGELIQMKLRHNQQALTVLSNAVNKTGVYGRNGQPHFAGGSSRTLGSG